MPPRRSPRPALVAFVLLTVVCVAGSVAFLVSRRQQAVARATPATGTSAASASPRVDSVDGHRLLAAIRAQPHVYYRSVRPGEFGHVVVAALDAPDDRRVVSNLVCDRLDFGRQRGICLIANDGVTGPAARAMIVDLEFNVLATIPLAGTPIRTRLSPDEQVAAATVFVTGEHYDADFTTRTTLIDLRTLTSVADLEQFKAERDGRPFSRIDFNYWGVTFRSNSQRFFATLGYTGTRFLVEGNAEGRKLRVIRDNVECPSLSPDERLIAFKSRVPGSREWRLHVLEPEGSAEWAVAGETRNIDDQVEWLDAGHVLYQVLEDRGLPEDALSVWTSPVEQGVAEPPVRFIRAANSPAVVRP